MSGAWRAIRAVALGAIPAAVAYVTSACPALFDLQGALAAVGGILAAVLSTRASAGPAKSTGAGLASAGVLALVYAQAQAEISRLCGTEFLAQLPTLLTTAAVIGIGAYLHGKPLPAQNQPPVV